jgi:hypothetical protein
MVSSSGVIVHNLLRDGTPFWMRNLLSGKQLYRPFAMSLPAGTKTFVNRHNTLRRPVSAACPGECPQFP